MTKIPNQPEDIFDEFKDNYIATFGDDILSICLFGSGARGEYTPKKSDINFLIVLTADGIDRLDEAMGLMGKWRKQRVAVPLFLTRDFIESSLDTFPLEIFNIRAAYKVIYGNDVLSGLTIKEDDLRLQCERELKAKLLLLRRSSTKS